jgi:hypothetical protein
MFSIVRKENNLFDISYIKQKDLDLYQCVKYNLEIWEIAEILS